MRGFSKKSRGCLPASLEKPGNRGVFVKFMLLTAATGGGHLRASAAVEQYIRDNTGYEVVTVDFLKAINRFLDKTVCDS